MVYDAHPLASVPRQMMMPLPPIYHLRLY